VLFFRRVKLCTSRNEVKMREIKFRAWDEGNKIMHYDFEFIRSGVDGNDWILFKSDKQTLEQGKVLDNPYFQQQLKIMQFTGLKDKKGKEIYEGDILQGSETSPKYEVLMNAGAWSASYKYQGNSGAITLFNKLNLFEIIGNIYENHELLPKDIKDHLI
jgi:YopX protein